MVSIQLRGGRTRVPIGAALLKLCTQSLAFGRDSLRQERIRRRHLPHRVGEPTISDFKQRA
jgi:hypothetical protein